MLTYIRTQVTVDARVTMTDTYTPIPTLGLMCTSIHGGGGRCFERKEKRITRNQYGQEVKGTKMKESQRKKDAGAPFLGVATAAGMKVCMKVGVK